MDVKINSLGVIETYEHLGKIIDNLKTIQRALADGEANLEQIKFLKQLNIL